MLVDPARVYAEQRCDFRWRKNEVTRPVPRAFVLDR